MSATQSHETARTHDLAKDRDRLAKLLTLARESSFVGEREAAAAAAARLAEKLGLAPQEAVWEAFVGQANTAAEVRTRRQARAGDYAAGFAWNYDESAGGPGSDFQAWSFWQRARAQASSPFFNAAEAAASRARQRQEEARHEAQRAAVRARYERRARTSDRRLSPRDFAAVLIRETSFSLREISLITGLSIYDVICVKLILRTA